MIQVQDLEKRFAGRTLFQDATFQLLPGRRYGVVGANGAGKTTFLRMLMGKEEPSGGSITIPRRSRVAFLDQNRFGSDDERIIDLAMRGDDEAWAAMSERDALLAESAPDAGRLADLEERVAAVDGYTLESRAARILEGLGIPTSRHQEPLRALSGGFKLRVLLAGVLASRPDILLLDEPTNHLDIITIRWLEGFLREVDSLVVLVSHDHTFLDRVSSDILDVDYERITHFAVPYHQFVIDRAQMRERKEKEIAKKQREIDEKQAFVDRFKAKATKARQAQSRMKQIAKIDVEVLAQSSRRAPVFRFTPSRPSGKEVVTVDAVKKSYDGRAVLSDVSFVVRRGERVCFLGPNGVGKSTFLKIIAGVLQADEGSVVFGHETRVGYVPQDHEEAMGRAAAPLDFLWSCMPDAAESTVRGALGRALFTGDDVKKPVGHLSGGEKARLLFARVQSEQPNVLILDEPTNHLDLESITALADSLMAYEGTLLVVSHDRWFVEKIATRVVTLSTDGFDDFHGNYAEYLAKTGVDHLDGAAPSNEARAVVTKAGDAAQRREKNKERDRRRKKLTSDIDAATALLQRLENEKRALDAEMCDPAFFTGDQTLVKTVTTNAALLDEKILHALTNWEALEEDLVALDADDAT